MRNIQNKSLKFAPLNVRGIVYTGDADGIFAMQPEHADLIVDTPGWIATIMPYLPDAKAARDYWAEGRLGQPTRRSKVYLHKIRLRGAKQGRRPWIELRVHLESMSRHDEHVIPCTIRGHEIPDAKKSHIHHEDILGIRWNRRPKEKGHYIMRLRPWIVDDLWPSKIQKLSRFRRGIDKPVSGMSNEEYSSRMRERRIEST